MTIRTPGIRVASVLGVIVAATMVIAPGTVMAAPGDLDPTFGGGGIVVTGFGTASSEAGGAIALPGGKVLAFGDVHGSRSAGIALLRYLANGNLDPSFGQDGRVRTNFGASVVTSAALRLPNGKVVVGGTTSTRNDLEDLALVRYLPNGSIDTTFGKEGRVRVDVEAEDSLAGLARTSNGELVAVGLTDEGAAPVGMIVAKFHPNGSLDRAFGDHGTLVLGHDDEAWAVIVDAHDRILAAGCRGCGNFDGHIEVVRLLPDGRLDPTFGEQGIVLTNLAGKGDDVYAMAARPNGKFVVAGCTGCEDGRDRAVLVRYMPSGSLDPSFGRGGTVVGPAFGAPTRFFGVDIDAQGRVLATGNLFGVARYTAAGKPDTTFSHNGVVNTRIGHRSFGSCVTTDESGRIVVAGTTVAQSGHSRFAVARYEQ